MFVREMNGFESQRCWNKQPKMRSDKGSAGVIFTLDTESGFRDVVLVNTSYGPKAITVGLGMIITETPPPQIRFSSF